MSDIKKQLILEVSLGTQKLKSEIAGLKKDLESVGRGMGGQAGTPASKKSGVSADLEKAKQINMAYKQRQKEQDQLEKAYSQRQKEITREQEKATREMTKLATKKENAARKEAQRIEKATEKEVKQNEAAIEKEQAAKIKAEQKESKRAETQRQKDLNAEKRTIQERFDFLKKKDLENSIRKSQLDRSATAKLARAFGVSDEKARDLAETVHGTPGRTGRGGMSSGLALGLGSLLKVGAEVYDFSQFRRTQNAQMASAQNSAIKSGDYVGGQIQGFRSTKHGLGRMFSDIATSTAIGAGAGFAVGGVGAIPGALAGLGVGALRAGRSYLTGQQEERDRLMLETEPARQAQERQRQVSNIRFDLLRQTGRTMGGANPLDRMTSLQHLGTMNGFSQEETLSQLGGLRQYIGTNAASNVLYKGQQLYNQTGVGLESQGKLSEAVTTGERGTFEAGNAKLEGIIRKGMAFGIKDGKLDQYARITADAVQRNAEMGGQQDATAIANEVASRARGLAGEGDITESTLSQAVGIQDLLRQKSSQTTGLAGANNFLGIKQAVEETGVELSPAQMMLAAQTSNKGGAALKELLVNQGMSEDQAKSVVDKTISNKDNFNLGTGSKDVDQFLKNQLYGTTTEKTLDIDKSRMGGTADAEAISLQGRGTAQGGAEGTLIQKNAQVDFKNFQAGLDNIEVSTKLVNTSLQTFNENLQQSFRLMHEFLLNNGNLSK